MTGSSRATWRNAATFMVGLVTLAPIALNARRPVVARTWQERPQHYVFFNRDRERIAEPSFLETDRLVGAQLKYAWKELERGEGGYDFSEIERDLAFLTARGKRLFIQLQDVSFDTTIVNVPAYLRTDPRFGGGVAMQYQYEGDDESLATQAGWVARRWDEAVQERLHALFDTLGAQFDGRIEGINLAETAIEFGTSGRLFPEAFTPNRYRDAIIENMLALKRAFPQSVGLLYANFMPGEALPENDRGYLTSVYARAREAGVALGGPDLLPTRRGQMRHSYPLIRESSGTVPTGVAVQWGNYAQVDPETGRRLTIPELIDFATQYLGVRYIFWGTQEPYYTDELIPLLVGNR